MSYDQYISDFTNDMSRVAQAGLAAEVIVILVVLFVILVVGYTLAQSKEKTEGRIEALENGMASDISSKSSISGFTFEDTYFLTPRNTIIPYSYEFMTMLETDGTLTIHLLSLHKVETYTLTNGEEVLKEISRRKRESNNTH